MIAILIYLLELCRNMTLFCAARELRGRVQLYLRAASILKRKGYMDRNIDLMEARPLCLRPTMVSKSPVRHRIQNCLGTPEIHCDSVSLMILCHLSTPADKV